mmetsp:Transcript_11065/g.16819  ORF Transcript_11065/g.16819 Transcript_11065/m.16819 type:complete len:97 (+) Transcript_11065:135-425(+)
MFENYMKKNFELKNMMKYIENEQQMIFSFEFLQKMFMASFLFKNFIMERHSLPQLKQRREYLKEGNTEGYKKVLSTLADMEEEAFQVVFKRVKQKT